MANGQYTVASTAQLVGVPTEERFLDEIKAMDHANREKSRIKRKAEIKKGVQVPPTSLRTDGIQEGTSPGTDIFTHSRHASWNGSSPTTAIPDSLPRTPQEEEPVPLLQPVAYTPPVDKTEIGSSKSNDSQSSVKERAKEYEAQMPARDLLTTNESPTEEVAVDPEASAHIRSPSGESTSSTKRRGRRSDGSEIYFTPTDYTKSKIFLSSPQNSPTLPDGEAGDEATTPTASTTTNRPSSETYVGPKRIQSLRTKKKEKLKITPDQLDQLVTGLAKAPMIQKDVRKHWWDVDDIPDDETVSSFSAVSIPTLTSASTLYSSFYSHPNDHLASDQRPSKERRNTPDAAFTRGIPSAKKPTTTPTTAPSFNGIALADPKIHGSPIRYVSSTHPLPVGSCSFVQVPYGVDVECTLRVEPRSSNTPSRVILQCVNQVVDRKTGTKTHLLLASEDVTSNVQKAALAEFATFTKTPLSNIECTTSPTAPSPFSSPSIDWIAIADDLQRTSETNALIDSALHHFTTALTPTTAHMATHTLLSTLERIKDQHLDFMILQPTAWRENGVPRGVRVPWVSQRLWKDWYAEGEGGVGVGEAARGFREGVVGAVAKAEKNKRKNHTNGGGDGGEGYVEEFTTTVKWEDERLVVKCVPLGDGGSSGTGVVWACFVRGMFDI
ncbi:hypothetical protein M409DRAFT_20348 [Zasmidium cellare ATCC 36951]|uniref:Uncharacterized protein n=1 Tax=Zasmidium cellare ATCC 36951 TaxID=1080233 RepID=A0A6A6CSI8_ZASCE|nr:uncharacterized protein M409DRAFT_20348 [Zasmidium cellare ATCC 36951]KAF2169120.1 hypothetical protein M409DRAFT_20348 [Zasmidium cellare ATCC 36951]